MRFTISAAVLLAFTSRAFAQTSGFDAMSTPTQDENVAAGSTYEIKWAYTETYSGTVTLTLLEGATPATLQLGDAIATGVDNSKGSFSWAVDSSLGNSATYGIKISLDSDPTTFQYSFPFHITASTSGSTDASSNNNSVGSSSEAVSSPSSTASTVASSSSSYSAAVPTNTLAAGGNSSGNSSTESGSATTTATASATTGAVTTSVGGNSSAAETTAATKTTLSTVKSSSTATSTSSSASSTSSSTTVSSASRAATGSFALLAGLVAAVFVL